MRRVRFSLAIAGILLLALAVSILQARTAAADNTLNALAGVLEDFAVGVLVAGLGSVVFGLVPLRFLPARR